MKIIHVRNQFDVQALMAQKKTKTIWLDHCFPQEQLSRVTAADSCCPHTRRCFLIWMKLAALGMLKGHPKS